MTLAEARARVPRRVLPPFWVGDVADLAERLARVERGEVSVLTTSPGGRPIHLVAYGRREDRSGAANFNSAVGGRDLTAYADKAAREKPVVLFVGPVHGQETEGLTGLVNLLQVMETGRDLRGREQPELREWGDRCRLLIVPTGNPDGVARFEPRTLLGMEHDDLCFWGEGTWADGSLCDWPQCKRRHPMAGEVVGFRGCYFNDAGVNPMHDEFFHPFSTEAPALLHLAQLEAPDYVVSLHSHSSNPTVLRPAYVPIEVQQHVADFAGFCYAMLEKRGLPHGVQFVPGPETGEPPAPFNLVSALYHISGAAAFTFECPHGLRGEKTCSVSWEQILDIQLTLALALFRFAVAGAAEEG